MKCVPRIHSAITEGQRLVVDLRQQLDQTRTLVNRVRYSMNLSAGGPSVGQRVSTKDQVPKPTQRSAQETLGQQGAGTIDPLLTLAHTIASRDRISLSRALKEAGRHDPAAAEAYHSAFNAGPRE